MPEMRRKDDTKNKKVEYIYCSKRRNNPRLNVLICEQCRYRKNCVDYQAFLAGLDVDTYKEINKKSNKRKKRKKRTIVD
jgi:hypothetical protein